MPRPQWTNCLLLMRAARWSTGLLSSYEVSEDNRVWTFHLREDALWSDGTPVTSEDFRNTIERALDPASGSGYAVYLFPIENAEEIYNGEADMDSLGVETPDDNTLIFRLDEACVYFPGSAAASRVYAFLPDIRGTPRTAAGTKILRPAFPTGRFS